MARFLRLLCLSCCLVGSLCAKDAAVVFVLDPSWDCVSSYVANVPLLQEYKIIKVWTRQGVSKPCTPEYADIYKNITYNSVTPNPALAAEEICPQLRSLGFPVAAVIATYDPAVALGDRLSACVGTRGNPFEGPLAKARRDKWAEGEAVRKAGLRSVKEKMCTSWTEGKDYLEAMNPPLSHSNPVIFKITGGSSSEGVQKVYSLEQAEEIFSREIGSMSAFGYGIGEILIQEFLAGKEYVIDSVSRDGVHKAVMVWFEDLRPGNGIPFLYYGFKVMDPEDEKIKVIVDYAHKVLDATGLQNGASDMEVIWLEEEGRPCLVDLNARWTGLMWKDGLAIEKAVTGTDQITETINAFLDGDAFDKLPAVPTLKQNGAMVFTNVFRNGTLMGIPGLAVAEKLPSYMSMSNERAVVGKPIEVFTKGHPPVTILLTDKDLAVVDADYDRIIGLTTSDAFWDIKAPTGDTSLTALRSRDLPVHLPVIAALAMLAAAGTVALAAMSQRNVRDDTEYLTIE